MVKNAGPDRRLTFREDFRRNGAFYLMVLPGLISLLLFSYGPMVGLSVAFLDYNPIKGFMKSNFVGLEHFEAALSTRFMWDAIKNTVFIKVFQTLITFPFSVGLALLLGEVGKRYRKMVQTATILPYFISWIVVASMFKTIFSANGGLVNAVLTTVFGWEKAVDFMSDPEFFRWLIIFQDAWKMGGYFAIIYLSAITAIDETLYEVARIDGAGRWRQIFSITLPGIKPTLITMAIMLSGYLIVGPFDQVFTQYSPSVYSTSDIVETYTFRMGYQNQKYGFSTAVSLMQSVVATSLVLLTNLIIRRVGREDGMF